jgi:Rrf2 family protein
MKLSNGIEQAIHSVVMLTGLSEEGVLSAAALAEFHGVSTSYLLKHLQALSSAGILQTTPGPKGGYSLAQAPRDISLLDIVLAVEGSAPAFRCNEIRRRGPNPPPAHLLRAPCSINAAMLRAEQTYRKELAGVTVEDILKDVMAQDDGSIQARGCAFLAIHERKQTQKP